MSRVKLPHRLGDEFDGEPPVKPARAVWRGHPRIGEVPDFFAFGRHGRFGRRIFFSPNRVDAEAKAARDRLRGDA